MWTSIWPSQLSSQCMCTKQYHDYFIHGRSFNPRKTTWELDWMLLSPFWHNMYHTSDSQSFHTVSNATINYCWSLVTIKSAGSSFTHLGLWHRPNYCNVLSAPSPTKKNFFYILLISQCCRNMKPDWEHCKVTCSTDDIKMNETFHTLNRQCGPDSWLGRTHNQTEELTDQDLYHLISYSSHNATW